MSHLSSLTRQSSEDMASIYREAARDGGITIPHQLRDSIVRNGQEDGPPISLLYLFLP